MIFNKEIQKFYDEIMKDEKIVENIKEKFNEKNQKEFTEENLKDFLNKYIMPIAIKKGFDFSLQELLTYEIEIKKENKKIISENELEEISGGGITKSLMVGSVSAILMLGAGVAINNDTHAEVQLSDVESSIDSISEMQNSTEVNKNDEKNKSLLPTVESTDTPVLSEPIKDEDENEDENENDDDDDKKEKITASTEKVEQNNSPLAKEEKQKIMASSSVDKTVEISKPSDNVVENQETDVEYVAEALNMVEPYIYKLTGVTKNFRLYNGNISDISIGKNLDQGNTESRIYNRDGGKGSADVMRCLFPSTSGELNSEGGSDRLTRFTEDCKPTPELMAEISGYLYKIRSKSINVTQNLMKIDAGKASKKDFLKNFFDYNVEVKREGKEEKTLFDLLKNMTFMMQNEECDKEIPTEQDMNLGKVLPKYTTEHMFMSYFIDHFNTKKDVNDFYNAVKKQINVNGTKENNSEKTIQKLKDLKFLIQKAGFNEMSPYVSKPVENGTTKKIEPTSINTKNVAISNSSFADCADVAVRHVMNFLLYNGDGTFNSIQGGSQEDLDNLIDAIDNNKEFESKSLKERLQLFYLHQTKDKVNDGSTLTRTIWNYVISNMNNTEQMELLNLYPVKYVNNKSCELETGFVNSIKLYYNIAYALKDGQNCNEAKIVIDNLNEESSEENLKEALEKTLKILNSKTSVSNMNINKNYGFATIKMGDIEFTINQEKSHAYIDYSALKQITINEEIENILNENEMAKLLVCKANDYNDVELSVFQKLYSKQGTINEKNKYVNKYKALKFLKEFEGEENNIYRIFKKLDKNTDFLYGAKSIFISNAKSKNTSMLNYICGKYIYSHFKSMKNNTQQEIENIVEKNSFTEINNLKYYLNKYDNTCILCDCDKNNLSDKLVIQQTISVDKKDFIVESISDNTFSECKTLKAISIPKSVNYIGKNMFSGCENLESIDFETGIVLNCINEETFSECINLKSIKLPSGITKISDNSFKGCKNLETLEIPKSVVEIGNNAFEDCSKLKNLIVPANIEHIGDRAFSNCSSLNSVIFEEGSKLKTIEYASFEGCSSLKEISIPNSVMKIADYAFANCTELRLLKLSDNKVELTNLAFSGCTELKEFAVNSKNLAYYSSNDGILFDGVSKKLVSYPSGKTEESYKIPKDIATIESYAFSSAKELKSVVIPKNVTLVNRKAFDKCKKLKKIVVSSKSLKEQLEKEYPNVTVIYKNKIFNFIKKIF